MNNSQTYTQLYVLKISGQHGLVFKCKHASPEYLQQLADQQLNLDGTHFTHYDIHPSSHSNSELTQCELLLHFTPA
ncbi:hypothetical protein [Thiomicrorhabdus lithotrophica]|uniref:Uncharacterized protein n=1 Tax=Thiomicrorhabdus lithotrophica TaxID=2949997 RepID=A0ABY8CB89_9GAMM|nr:hypothetical protein [Thiomicrorhabdus lithotrophica]WEJ62077.1 hypothetical protein NR989_08630 [Thiomicrorhabdus lithotrophica]